MTDLNDLDVELLFKKLVILKEDKNAEQEVVEADVEQTVTQAVEPPTKEAPAEALQEVIEQQIPAKSLIYPKALKAELFANNSNLSKIANALNLQFLLESAYALEDIKSLETLNTCSHIWFIGLEKPDILGSLNSEIKTLSSPNMERLTTKEEKLQMYEPLKKFAAEITA